MEIGWHLSFLPLNKNADGNRGTPWTKNLVGFETDGVRERDRFVGGGLVVFVCVSCWGQKNNFRFFNTLLGTSWKMKCSIWGTKA